MSSDPQRLALVLGASGDQGGPQVEALARSGWRVRAASRSGSVDFRLSPQTAALVECVKVDYGDNDSLARALEGVQVLLANYPSSSFNEGAALVAAAELTARLALNAEVELVVFNSSLPLPERSLGMPAQDVRLAQRAALRDGGLRVVSLQPVVYMDNLLRGWAYPSIAERNCFEYPHRPELEVSWLCLHDLATIAAAVAARPDLAGRDLAIGGPEILRGEQVAATLSAICGRRITFSSLPIESFGARMAGRFADKPDARSLRHELERIYTWYNESPTRPFRVEMDALTRELGVTLTPFRAWAERQNWSGEGR
jgi:uncharacterized protein YbjT (DUF2867 family)